MQKKGVGDGGVIAIRSTAGMVHHKGPRVLFVSARLSHEGEY